MVKFLLWLFAARKKVTKIQVLSLRTGDIILITLPRGVSQQQTAAFLDEFKRHIPDYQIACMSEEIGLQVVRRAA